MIFFSIIILDAATVAIIIDVAWNKNVTLFLLHIHWRSLITNFKSHLHLQGVRNLKGTDLNPVYVLIKPPSLEVLEQRLRGRKTETDESLRKRLEVAKTELDYGKHNNTTLYINFRQHNIS